MMSNKCIYLGTSVGYRGQLHNVFTKMDTYYLIKLIFVACSIFILFHYFLASFQPTIIKF